MMAKSGYKRQPSPWPTGAFVLIKLAQLLSALIILGILGFFSYHLREDRYPIPWQFALMGATVRLFSPLPHTLPPPSPFNIPS